VRLITFNVMCNLLDCIVAVKPEGDVLVLEHSVPILVELLVTLTSV